MRISKLEKEHLEQAFSVPEPKKKRTFLRSLPKQEVGLGTLILSQAAYIRKWVWAVSLLLFGLVVGLAGYVELNIIWMLSAIMPFAALLIVMEFAKSSAYGILLSRMIMLGTVQFAGLLLTMPITGPVVLQNGVYLLVPYLLTAMLGLVAVRRLHGKESMYVCGSISAFVCILCPLSNHFVPALYEEKNVMLWVLSTVLLMAGIVREYKKTINDLEEMVWNWS